MATETVRIIITAKGAKTVQRQLRGIGTSADASKKALQQMRNALVVVAAARVAARVVQVADAFTLLDNRLRAVLGSLGEAQKVRNQLVALAIDTRTSFEATGDAFARLAQGASDLGLSTQVLLDVTKTLNQSILLSGVTAIEAQNAMIQLAQGISSGALRGDELRSVLEQLPAVAKIIADEFKVTRGELRILGEQGKLTTARLINAFETAAPRIAALFAEMDITIGQAFVNLNTNITVLVASFSEFSGAGAALASSVEGVSAALRFLTDNLEILVAVGVVLATSAFLKLFLVLATKNLLIVNLIGIAFLELRAGLAFTTIAANFASGAMVALRAAITLLTGPIGIILAVIGVITFALVKMKKARDEIEKAGAATGQLLADLEEGINLPDTLEDTISQIDVFNDQIKKAQVVIDRFAATDIMIGAPFGPGSQEELDTAIGLLTDAERGIVLLADASFELMTKLAPVTGELEVVELALKKLAESAASLRLELQFGEALAKAIEDAGGKIDENGNLINLTKTALADLRIAVGLTESLQGQIDAVSDAEKELQKVQRTRLKDAKDLIEDNRTLAQVQIDAINEVKTLLPELTAELGSEEEALKLIEKASIAAGEAAALAFGEDARAAILETLTLREQELLVVANAELLFDDLVQILGSEAEAREVVNKTIERELELLAEEEQKKADAAIALRARFDEEFALQQELAEVKKIFAEAEGTAQEFSTTEQQSIIQQITLEAQAGTTALDGFKQGLFQVASGAQSLADVVQQGVVGAFTTAGDALAEFAVTGKINFKELVLGVVKGLISMAIQFLITTAAAAALAFFTGGASITAGLSAGGAEALATAQQFQAAAQAGAFDGALGFKDGGEFQVGGGGGPDSQLVQFLASPDETVSIRTPAQQRDSGGDGGPTIFIDARGADAEGLARLEQIVVNLNGSIEKRAVSAVVDRRRREPTLFN